MMSIETKIASIMAKNAQTCGLNDLRLILNNLSFQKSFKIITIAGTNGKGTTVAMLEELFRSNGKKFISHTSPHVFVFNERIATDSGVVDNQLLMSLLDRVESVSSDYKLSYYQIAFLCACILSQEINIDYLIMEVGIGGRLDAANLLDHDMTAITNIDLDHCEILGDTLESIGLEKVGISRENIPLFLGSKMPRSVYIYANRIGAKTIEKQYNSESLNCFYDSYNIAMAIAEELFDNKCINHIPQLSDIRANARYKIIKNNSTNNSDIIVDVAHNEASVKHLFKLLANSYDISKYKISAVFGILSSKDLSSIIDVAKNKITEWQIIDLKRLDSRALDINSIKMTFENKSIYDVSYHDSLESINIQNDNTLTVVFGSFVLAGEFLSWYEENSIK